MSNVLNHGLFLIGEFYNGILIWAAIYGATLKGANYFMSNFIGLILLFFSCSVEADGVCITVFLPVLIAESS